MSDLSPLSGLQSLQTLNCNSTQVSDLSPLSGLQSLQSLYCNSTQVSDLSPLAGLQSLQTLYCNHTQVSDLSPLAGHPSLHTLNCAHTQVSDLSPLAGLPSLHTLDCSDTQVSDLSPLAGLHIPSSHSPSIRTQVSDLSPLAALQSLQSLDCSSTQASDLSPLAGLQSLQSLDCHNTQVSDLAPLAASNLSSRSTATIPRSATFAPLATLQSLQSLDCHNTQVSDLVSAGWPPISPVARLLQYPGQRPRSAGCSPHPSNRSTAIILRSATCSAGCSPIPPIALLLTIPRSATCRRWLALQSLQSLSCYNTQVSDLPEALVWRHSLESLYLFGTRITEIPAEVLSSDPFTNCLESLRAHLRDLKKGEERLPDVKVLVLGNGRIGKTQICRRLRGEDFQPDADSTHGITVTAAPLTMPHQNDEQARLHLWDFGGQDLYHGTHALFMRTRSVFLLAWTHQSENAREHTYRGMTFRNHRLAYWLEYVRHLSSLESPVIIVQNMCDQPTDKARILASRG